MSDTDLVLACPGEEGCGSTKISSRSGRLGTVEQGSWRCETCGLTFEEPERRPAKKRTTRNGLSAVGKLLVEMDPADLGGAA